MDFGRGEIHQRGYVAPTGLGFYFDLIQGRRDFIACPLLLHLTPSA